MLQSKKRILKQLMTVLTFVIFTTLSYGQNGTRECGNTHYSTNYKPTIAKSIAELPNYIQDSIKKHLLNKLGHDFYELLTFESCLVIDYCELVRQDSSVLNYRWQVPKYDLGFYITQKKAGIDYYCSRMTLDSLGIVIESVDFPNSKINPQSTRFADFTQIQKTSKKMGFDPNYYEIDFIEDHLAIKFVRIEQYKYIEYLCISAHSGKKIKQFKSGGIIDWF